ERKPAGGWEGAEQHRAGGITRVRKILLENGRLHGGACAITGETIEETWRDVPATVDGDVIRPFDAPLYRRGHLSILRGNLATEGAVAKTSGVKAASITGPARVFDSEESCLEAILVGRIARGDVIVI